MDLVSIIVPVYNAGAYLSKCLKSLVNQTYQNIEIIVVDDGSTDNSLEIAKKFEILDRRVKVFHKQNGGQASARNYGISKCTGEYIGFVDADDYVDLNMYEVLVNLCADNNADISVCGWYIVKEGNIKKCDFTSEKLVLTSEMAIDKLLDHVSFDNFATNKLFKRKLFDNILFPINELLEDLLTIYRLFEEAKLIVIFSQPLYYYVQHEKSITHQLQYHLNIDAFKAFEDRRIDLLKKYPNLTSKINSNYVTACKLYFMISLKSDNRNKKFEKERISEMRKYIKDTWKDNSISFRVKTTTTLISYFPYSYFKLRGLFK